jgi:Zn-finger nucleic acid-binding protein
MSRHNCPKCFRAMSAFPFRMSKLDNCSECRVFFFEPVELDFLLGQSVEELFFRDPLRVTTCDHCHQSLNGDSHCGERQRLSCASCEDEMKRARLIVQTPYTQSESPYREENLTTKYEEKADHIEVCTSCRSILISQTLFDRLMPTQEPT